ncbi:MAG: hypothetical protein COB54_00110 [Alphaproteobacteria bacterium]|nr:MAG: hypothetical protein COB54_00110 [Alphaproteobacteria bacterium]
MEIIDNFLSSTRFCGPVIQLAQDNNIAPLTLIEDLGISEPDLADPTVMLNSHQQVTFITNVLKAFSDEGIGLKAGLAANYKDLGMLGLAMLSSPSYRHALKVGSKFARTAGSFLELKLIEQGDRLGHQVLLPPLAPDVIRYLTEESFASIFTYSSTLLGSDDHEGSDILHAAEAISFAYPRPRYGDMYDSLFACPLTFDADVTTLWYDRDLFEKSLPMSNQLASSMCESQCSKLLEELREKDQIIQDIRLLISSNLDSFPSLEHTADQMAMSPRTLRRRLQQQGSSYSRIMGDVKSSFAFDLLKNPALSIVDIAEILGYSELTNFRRAFRSWTGSTPSQYRQSVLK